VEREHERRKLPGKEEILNAFPQAFPDGVPSRALPVKAAIKASAVVSGLGSLRIRICLDENVVAIVAGGTGAALSKAARSPGSPQPSRTNDPLCLRGPALVSKVTALFPQARTRGIHIPVRMAAPINNRREAGRFVTQNSFWGAFTLVNEQDCTKRWRNDAPQPGVKGRRLPCRKPAFPMKANLASQ